MESYAFRGSCRTADCAYDPEKLEDKMSRLAIPKIAIVQTK